MNYSFLSQIIIIIDKEIFRSNKMNTERNLIQRKPEIGKKTNQFQTKATKLKEKKKDQMFTHSPKRQIDIESGRLGFEEQGSQQQRANTLKLANDVSMAR